MRQLIVGVLLACAALNTEALTYSEWIQANKAWQRGYVFAYADYVKSIAQEGDPSSIKWAEGYQVCFKGFTDQALLRTVDEYLARNPTAKTEPLILAVNGAMRELCKKHLPLR